MKGIELFDDSYWKPLSAFGIDNTFVTFNAHTLINTWVVLAVLIILAIATHFILKRKSSISRYMLLTYIQSFVDLCSQTFGFFSFAHSAFIIALFTFIVLCNCIAIIPWVEEPTKDLNTTLALGIFSFVYIQLYAIKEHGFFGYLKEYFAPFFFMFPLHVIGKLSTIVSISFRLFGNIFGGATIVHIYNSVLSGSWLFQLAGLVTGLNIVIIGFFILFEGFLQAFVFTMLAMTYLAIALAHEEIGEMT
jgi:F-type H+-transporting ATPase subunit a